MSYVRVPGPYQVPLPYLARPVGLGDAFAGLTRLFGVKPCGACKARQVRWNGWLTFVPPRR